MKSTARPKQTRVDSTCELNYCLNCGSKKIAYHGTEDGERYKCEGCGEWFDYSNPNHT